MHSLSLPSDTTLADLQATLSDISGLRVAESDPVLIGGVAATDINASLVAAGVVEGSVVVRTDLLAWHGCAQHSTS